MGDLTQGLVTGPAVKFLGSLVPECNPVIRISDEYSIEAEVQQASLSCQLCISLLSVCNIASHRELHETAVGHSQGGCMGLHVAAHALESHDVEFQRTSFASTDFFIEGTKSVSILGSSE